MDSVRTRMTARVAAVTAVGVAVSVLAPATAQPSAAGEPPDPVLRLQAVPGSVVRSLDVPLDGVARSRGGGALATGPMRASAFSLVGLTWHGAAEPTIRIRTLRGGAWTGWQAVPHLHDLPDAGTEGITGLHSTQPWWVGRSTGIDVQITGAARDLELALIDPGATAVDARTTASRRTAKPKPDKPNKAPKPRIRSRKSWGAKERWRNGGPYYNRTIQQVHVHHTATGNDYRRKDVPALLRSVYRYHTHNLGWSDIGYNFVVDRFGRTWQGRAGGNARPVRGAHTLGFNETSTGVAVLGTFTSKAANERVRRAIVHLAAWKLDRYHRRPKGKATVFSRGSDKFPAGTKVRLRVIDGHRDTNDTECPGGRLYKKLPGIRLRAQERVNRFDPPR
jgi:hypothetical protein